MKSQYHNSKTVAGINTRYMAIALILTLCLSIASPIPVEANGQPNFVIQGQEKMPVFKAGSDVRLSVPIRNIGNDVAFDVVATIDRKSTKPEDYPFTIDTIVPEVRVGMLDINESHNLVFNYTVPENVPSKIFTLDLKLDYRSADRNYSSTSKTFYVKIENDTDAPKVQINKSTLADDTLYAGETTKLSFELTNGGDMLAKDIKVQLDGLSPKTIYVEGVNQNSKTVKELASKQFDTSVFFDLTVDSKLETGVYEVNAVIEYKDQFDKEYKEETKLYLPVKKTKSDSKKAQLLLENIQYPKAEVSSGEDFTISFVLKNNSTENAKNVKVNVGGEPEILSKSMSVQSFPLIKAGETKTLTYTMFAKEKVEHKNYPIKITVDYETETNDENTSEISTTTEQFSQYVGVLVKKSDDDTKAMKPKLILDNYSLDREYIQAGSDFGLSISLLNTHAGDAIRNITVNVSAEGDVFSPVNSSNTFYIQSIGANQSVQRSLILRPKIDTEFKTHNLHLDIQYEDEEGNAHTSKEVIGIPVIQEVKLTVSEIELPNDVMLGNPVPISTNFYNAGRALVRNMTIRLEGDFDTQDRSMYIGNVEPGKNSYYDATITPTQPGEITGKVIFEFFDPIDQMYTVEREFTLVLNEFVDPGFPGEFPGGFPEEPNMNNSASKTYYYIGGGVLLVLVAGFLFYKRRKKQRELEEVDIHA